VLYSLLAASGMRISEALGLEIGKHFSANCSIVRVGQQRRKKGNGIEPYPKSDSGVRDIDLAPVLAALMKDFIGNRKSGFLLESANGLPLSPRNDCTGSPEPALRRRKQGSTAKC
jgi:integrase